MDDNFSQVNKNKICGTKSYHVTLSNRHQQSIILMWFL